MGFLGRKKKHSTLDKTESLITLASAIVSWALLSSKPISDACAAAADEARIRQQLDFGIRVEMLWFFLHMMERYAFATGGAELRASLQDEVAIEAIQAMVAASFDSSGVEQGFDAKGWETRMVNDLIEEYNESGLDYSTCKRLGVERWGDFVRLETVLGKLAARINHLVEECYDIELRLCISLTATEALAKSGLKQDVEGLCGKGAE